MSQLVARGLAIGHIGPLDLLVPAQHCLGLTGPSGSGKTRLLRALVDLDVHFGEVTLDGISMTAMAAPEWRRRVGLVAAESSWWRDVVGAHFATEVDEALLAALGFEREVLGWSISRLSAGERQRLALARTLVQRPRALLLDEPTAHLDAVNRDRVEQLIARYRGETGAAVIWVAHDREQLIRVSSERLGLDESGQPGEAT